MKQAIAFYVDGSCKPPPGAKGRGMMGAGIVGLCGPHQKEWSVPLGPGTNQLAEVLAVREALKVLGDRTNTAVTIFSDSEYCRGVLVLNYTVKVHSEVVNETKALIAECGSFQMGQVRGHSGDPMNNRAHKLAIQASSSQDPELLPPSPPKLPKVSDQLREITDQIVAGKNYEILPPDVQEIEKPRREMGDDRIAIADDFDAPLSSEDEKLWGLRQAEDYEVQVAHLETLVDQLVCVLRYYADNLTYLKDPERPEFIPPIVRDKGYKARQLLMSCNIPLTEDPFENPEN